jgi:MscS family membrane protein
MMDGRKISDIKARKNQAMEVGLRGVVIGCCVVERSKGRTLVLLSGWVALGLCLLLLLPSLPLAASSTDDTSLNGHPLRPSDTTSPQATLRSFQETAREVVRRHRGRLPPADVDRAIAKVLDTVNLSGLPPAERVDQGVELATLLLDILGRIALPPLAEIPDAAAVEASGLKRWTIPDTEITIARTEEGREAGRFQFTWPTMQQLPVFYELVKHLPPKPGSLAGVYEEWSYAPGPWIPSGWTMHLPAFAYIVVWHQRVWQWLVACAAIGLTAVVIFLAYRLALRIDRISSIDRNPGHLARLATTIAAIALLELATRVLDDAVNLTGRRLFLMNGVLDVAQYSAVGWTIILGLESLGAAVIRLREALPGSIDAALVRVVVRLLAISTAIFLAIWVAYSFGVPVTPLLASLGVGGLAIALAVRPTLENVIGGFILFADKPVRVGDFCRYGDEIGTVEEIGLRSTKIRSLERTTVTVPNAEFSQMKLDNFAKRDLRLLKTVLQLRHETTPEQMRWILAKLRELLLGHPMITPEPARVRFVGYGGYSKDVEIFAYLRCQDQDTFLAIKEDILLRVGDIVLEGGSGFAFPSQTTYFSRDGGLKENRKQTAENQVSLWRARGRLPFPEFEEHERDRLRDVLDYPPKGSPHYEPPRSAVERQQPMASSTFAVEDLADLPSFVAKLRVGSPLAEHLFSQFSAETRELLSNYEGGADAELTEALVRDLNAVVCGPAVYEEKRFERVDLGPETEELLKRPEGEDLQRLNRLLLQDAYPSALSRRKAMV